MECYLFIKDGLREEKKDAASAVAEKSLFFDAKNWSTALTAFADDMIIHQEAHRVGSFQASESAVKVARELFEKRKAKDSDLAVAVKRLGVDERTLLRTLHTILRTESFRRNKERQSLVARADDEGAPRWFEEIKDRAVVRYFSGAETYREIRPTQD
jgi:hypothetical protein